MSKTISVIIPVFMVENYLDQCIRSIVNQTYSNLDIILVDDGSPDQCPEICDQWEQRDPRIRVIHKKNGGLSDARNAGLDISKGEYISFVDSDDWIHPKMLERLAEQLERENADVCACNIIRVYPEKQVSWGAKKKVIGNAETMLDLLYSDTQFPVCAWNKLYRKGLWENLRFPAGKICEDAFIMCQILHRSTVIVQITEALYYYRIRANSIMTSSFQTKRMDEEEAWRYNCQFVEKYYPSLYKKAFTFYLQSVMVLVHAIKKSERAAFQKEYAFLKGILQKNLLFMLLFSSASIKYRGRFILEYLRL